jgi:two-component system, chemotaxis family, response regulator PixG
MDQVNSTLINPIEHLVKIASVGLNVAIEIEYQSVTYYLYLAENKLLYATNSVDGNGRLERYLKRFSHYIPKLKGIWSKISLETEDNNLSNINNPYPKEYQKIIWLAENNYLNKKQLQILGKKISQEILENLLLIPFINPSNCRTFSHNLPDICFYDLDSTIEEAKKRVSQWQSLMPEIQSSYQRPYFFAKTDKTREISSKSSEKLSKILKGFNFRELSAILNEDELTIAKRLYPLIERNTIILRNPKAEYEFLPQLGGNIKQKLEEKDKKITEKIDDIVNKNQTLLLEKNYKIACIDDSTTVLQSLTEFLNQDNISVFPITNAAKAMMLIHRIEPDLIFLDVSMPLIDGYQLCALLRKNPKFQDIPIIILTGNTGIVNRAKAKLSGATDYMTKPFNQNDILNIVFRYLTN